VQFPLKSEMKLDIKSDIKSDMESHMESHKETLDIFIFVRYLCWGGGGGGKRGEKEKRKTNFSKPGKTIPAGIPNFGWQLRAETPCRRASKPLHLPRAQSVRF